MSDQNKKYIQNVGEDFFPECMKTLKLIPCNQNVGEDLFPESMKTLKLIPCNQKITKKYLIVIFGGMILYFLFKLNNSYNNCFSNYKWFYVKKIYLS